MLISNSLWLFKTIMLPYLYSAREIPRKWNSSTNYLSYSALNFLGPSEFIAVAKLIKSNYWAYNGITGTLVLAMLSLSRIYMLPEVSLLNERNGGFVIKCYVFLQLKSVYSRSVSELWFQCLLELITAALVWFWKKKKKS